MPGQVEWTVRGKQCYPLVLCSLVSTFVVAHPICLLASNPSSTPACLRVVLKLHCTRPYRVCEVGCSHTPDASLSANRQPTSRKFPRTTSENRFRQCWTAHSSCHLVIAYKHANISGPKEPRGTRGHRDISEARFILRIIPTLLVLLFFFSSRILQTGILQNWPMSKWDHDPVCWNNSTYWTSLFYQLSFTNWFSTNWFQAPDIAAWLKVFSHAVSSCVCRVLLWRRSPWGQLIRQTSSEFCVRCTWLRHFRS